MIRSPIKKNKCKYDTCENWPAISYNGWCKDHAPDDLKEKVKTKKQLAKNKRDKRSTLTRKLWIAQKRVGRPLEKPKTKPIAKHSKKMLAELKIYKVLRKDFLKDHPVCEAKLEGCKRKSVEIHHRAGRGVNLNNVHTWIAVCRWCHDEIHLNSAYARDLELLIREPLKI